MPFNDTPFYFPLLPLTPLPSVTLSIGAQLTYFPHYLSSFRRLLRKVFRYPVHDVDSASNTSNGNTSNGNTSYHFTCADFQPLAEIEESPAYFIHVIVKQIEVAPFTLKAEQKK